MTPLTEEIFDSLKLRQGAWLINNLRDHYVAHTLEIGAEFDERPFQLLFKDYHVLAWENFPTPASFELGRVNADVIGMELGERAHAKPAVITTDLFEIIFTYDDLTIEKAW